MVLTYRLHRFFSEFHTHKEKSSVVTHANLGRLFLCHTLFGHRCYMSKPVEIWSVDDVLRWAYDNSFDPQRQQHILERILQQSVTGHVLLQSSDSVLARLCGMTLSDHFKKCIGHLQSTSCVSCFCFSLMSIMIF